MSSTEAPSNRTDGTPHLKDRQLGFTAEVSVLKEELDGDVAAGLVDDGAKSDRPLATHALSGLRVEPAHDLGCQLDERSAAWLLWPTHRGSRVRRARGNGASWAPQLMLTAMECINCKLAWVSLLHMD